MKSYQQPLNAQNAPAKQHQQMPFEVKLFFCAMLLLSWPVSMCLFLSFKPSVAYWFGSSELIIAVGVIVWIILSYVMFTAGALKRVTATLCILVLPCTVMAIFSEMQELKFKFLGTGLRSNECSSSSEKVHIQEAWIAAKNLSVKCDQYLMQATGAPINQIMDVRRFDACPGYSALYVVHKPEWDYIETLEGNYRCGGWCFPSYPLWKTANYTLDSCSLAAGQAMENSISHMGAQIGFYCFAVMLCITLLLVLAPRWLQEEDYMYMAINRQ
jgi:hypothetical protein